MKRNIYSDRSNQAKSSFIREILKVTVQKDFISFAGGLPNPISFPEEALAESAARIINEHGDEVFQYSTTEGYLPLREYIANHYMERFGFKVDAEDIMITTGSQQGLDLVAKVLINKGDEVIVEKPAYLGALQAFSMYEPKYLSVTLTEDGPNLAELEKHLNNSDAKLFYAVPNFQNPSGITYSRESREKASKLLKGRELFFIEDDPYGELRFRGEDLPYMGMENGTLMENSILFGTFSKTVTPGMRLGYICCRNKELMKRLAVAKQSTDLHTNIFAQYLIYDYLMHNDYAEHIKVIRKLYLEQSSAMVAAMDRYFPKEVQYTRPDGGMFMWVTLPKGQSSMELLKKVMEKKVMFVPGDSFYPEQYITEEFDGVVNTLRMNYSNCDCERITEGVRRMAECM